MNGHLYLANPSSFFGVPRFSLEVFDVVLFADADRMGWPGQRHGEGQCRWCMINRVTLFADNPAGPDRGARIAVAPVAIYRGGHADDSLCDLRPARG